MALQSGKLFIIQNMVNDMGLVFDEGIGQEVDTFGQQLMSMMDSDFCGPWRMVDGEFPPLDRARVKKIATDMRRFYTQQTRTTPWRRLLRQGMRVASYEVEVRARKHPTDQEGTILARIVVPKGRVNFY